MEPHQNSEVSMSQLHAKLYKIVHLWARACGVGVLDWVGTFPEVAMVDKRKSAPLQVQRGGRYLELKHSSSIAKRKSAGGLASPSNAASYNGVRMRVWGKWVTEVRDPVTKTRIWLGSFATAEMAARAYDAAMVCLKGASTPEVNFPDSIPSFVIPQSKSSPKEIQAVALAAATASVPAAAPLSMAATPELPNPPRKGSHEAPLEVTTDREFYCDGDAPEVNFPDSIPSFVIPQSNSWTKEIQAVALAAATASVPAAAPLSIAATPLLPNPPREESHEAPLEVTTGHEFYRDGGDGNYENGDGTANCAVLGPECSRPSNMEKWIAHELDFDDLEAAMVVGDPFSELPELLEPPFFPWLITSDDFEDAEAEDGTMTYHDMQLWDFA